MAINTIGNAQQTTPYWALATRNEAEAVWGNIPGFRRQLSNLQRCMAMVSFIDDEDDDIECRRSVIARYLRAYGFETETVKRYRQALPIQTFIDKALSAICTLYNSPPQRMWSKSAKINAEFEALYRDSNVNEALLQAEIYMEFLNLVALKPEYNSEGELKIRVITPDLFRVVEDDDYGDSIRQVWIAHARDVEGKIEQETIFRVYDKFDYWEADYTGTEIPGTRVQHGHDRIPIVVARLKEPTGKGFYGGGLFELFELQCWNNMLSLSATRGALYNAFSVWLARNMRWATEKEGDKDRNQWSQVQIAPDQVLVVENSYAGTGDNPYAPADLESKSVEAFFEQIDMYRRANVKERLINMDIPPHVADEGGGVQPVPGVTLEIMERGLRRRRLRHVPALKRVERGLAEIIRTEAALRASMTLPAGALTDFSVSFGQEEIYMEPGDRLAHFKALWEAGLIDTATYLQQTAEVDTIDTEEEAVEYIIKNLESVKRVRAASPPLPTDPAVSAPGGADKSPQEPNGPRGSESEPPPDGEGSE